jgi:hypothetical protein
MNPVVITHATINSFALASNSMRKKDPKGAVPSKLSISVSAAQYPYKPSSPSAA